MLFLKSFTKDPGGTEAHVKKVKHNGMPATHKALGWAEQYQDRLQPGKMSSDHRKELCGKGVMKLRGRKAEVPDLEGGPTNEEVTASFTRGCQVKRVFCNQQ